jgi:hypothetical protein
MGGEDLVRRIMTNAIRPEGAASLRRKGEAQPLREQEATTAEG